MMKDQTSRSYLTCFGLYLFYQRQLTHNAFYRILKKHLYIYAV